MASILPTLRFIANHPLSSRQPLRAYARYVRWQIESRLRREVEFNWVEGAKLIVRKGMTGATGNIYCGLHEFTDMALLLHMLTPEDLFIDVGANVGSYTILASAVCGARTIAIEPDPETMDALQQNILANEIANRVTAVQAALGSKVGKALLTKGRDTTNKIVVDCMLQDTKDTQEVRLKPLDELIGDLNPTFIKLDVEGYEAEVLRGATLTLRKPSLLAIETETSDEIIVGYLADAGFSRCLYDPQSRRFLKPDTDVSHIPRASNALFVRQLEACQQRVAHAPRRRILGQIV